MTDKLGGVIHSFWPGFEVAIKCVERHLLILHGERDFTDLEKKVWQQIIDDTVN